MSKSMISTQVSFGQVVIGPPGSGKTTYCNGMQQFLTAMGRKCCVVNLDPANDDLAYDCGIDINDLISVDDVVKNKGLGPNGALVYCMEYLNINREWLLYQIKEQKDVKLVCLMYCHPIKCFQNSPAFLILHFFKINVVMLLKN